MYPKPPRPHFAKTLRAIFGSGFMMAAWRDTQQAVSPLSRQTTVSLPDLSGACMRTTPAGCGLRQEKAVLPASRIRALSILASLHIQLLRGYRAIRQPA